MQGKRPKGDEDPSGDLEAGVIIHVSDQGATSPDPAPSTTDRHSPSAFGGDASARSNTAAGIYPDHEVK
jgi:hypothetical protein